MRPFIYFVGGVSLMMASQACTSGDSSSSAVLVRDSAGIRILEHQAPSSPSTKLWSVEEPLLTVGDRAAERGHDLYRVVGAVRLEDGTIVVANGATGELRRYAPDGDLIEVVGRLGEGPGEFRALSWFGRGGDSLRVWDRGGNLIRVFNGGQVQHARDYVLGSLPETPLSLRVEGSLSSGELLMARGPDFFPSVDGETEGVQRHPITAYLLSPTGQLLRKFGPFAGYAAVARRPVPFGAATLLAAGGDYVYVADNSAYDIRAFDQSGQLRLILRRPHDRMPVSAVDIAMDIETRLERVPESARQRARATLEAVPAAQFMPALKLMIADAEGNLWIRAAGRMDESEALWSVFSPDHGWLADIMLNASMEIMDVGPDWMIVRDTDELGVEVVRVLPLLRR